MKLAQPEPGPPRRTAPPRWRRPLPAAQRNAAQTAQSYTSSRPMMLAVAINSSSSADDTLPDTA